MPLRINRRAYETLIEGDIKRMCKEMPDSLERKHIIDVLEYSVEMHYPDQWPCQQLYGGKDADTRDNVDGLCKHPECHPRNDNR